MEGIGLKCVVAGKNREVVIPTTSAIGSFTGSSVVSVRDYVLEEVEKALKARSFKSEIFVVAGENGTWAATTT